MILETDTFRNKMNNVFILLKPVITQKPLGKQHERGLYCISISVYCEKAMMITIAE